MTHRRRVDLTSVPRSAATLAVATAMAVASPTDGVADAAPRGLRRPSRTVLVGSVLGFAAMAPGAAVGASTVTRPIPTVWPGWTATGDPTNTVGRVVGTDGTSFSADDGAGADDLRLFAAARGGDAFIGRFEDRALAQAGTATVLSTGRLVVQSSEAVGTSDDLGRHWAVAPVPRATVPRRQPVFAADGLHGIIVDSRTPAYSVEQPLPAGVRRGPGVLSTSDGGRTWRTAVEPEPPATSAAARAAAPRTSDPGPPEPRPRITVTAVLATPDGGFLRAIAIDRAADGDEPLATAIERSDDQGATWRRIWTAPIPSTSYQPASIDTLGLLASGRIVAALTDGTNTIPKTARPIVVVDPADGTSTGYGIPGDERQVACDPAGSCTVQFRTGSEAYRTATFDGTTLGPPSAPRPSVAPVGQSTVFHDHHVVVRTSTGAWSATRDGRRTTALPAPPTGADVEDVAQAPGGLVALFSGGDVWRLEAGRWTRLVDARSLEPSAVAASGREVLVAGTRGIARVRDGRLIREVRRRDGRTVGVGGTGRPLAPRFTGLDVRGSAVVAWARPGSDGPGQVVRSGDRGRSWRRLGGLPSADDVQQLSRRTIVASRDSALLVSRDAGRTFRTAGYTDAVTRFGYPAAFVHFRTLREGVMSTESGGSFLTRDGGRTFQALPRPGGPAAGVARVTAHGIVTDGPFGTILFGDRPAARLRTTRISIPRITAVDRAPNGRVRVSFRGRTRGIPEQAQLFTLSARARGGPPVSRPNASDVSVAADGTYSGEIDVLPGRRISLRYGGAFTDRPARASALSPAFRAPEPPRRRG